MMGSWVSGESKTSSESCLQACQTLPQSPFRLNGRKKKDNSKSKVSSKRLKTEHEVTQPSKNKDKSEDDPVEEKENTLRRSKRRRVSDSNIDLEKTAPTDVKHNLENDAKEIEDENLHQSMSFNFIPANVKKNLDKELFSEESDEEQDLNIKCPEDIVKEKQLVVFLKDINEAVKIGNTVQEAGNLDDDKTAIRKADCGTRSLPNYPQLFDENIADNHIENEINTKEEEIEENNTRDVTNEVLLNAEDNGNYERNDKAEFAINDKAINDPRLDLLYVDIKKADNIINSLKPTHTKNNCSEHKQTIHVSNSKPRLSSNDSMNGSIYTKKYKNVADTNARESLDVLGENSSESESSTPRKSCHLPTPDQQENSLKNMNYMETELNETIHEISSCSDYLVAKEEYNGVKYNSLGNKDSNNFNVNFATSENTNKITKVKHEYDSLVKLNDHILSKSELKEFLMENNNSQEKNDLDNSQISKKRIESFPIEVNNIKNITDDLKISVEENGNSYEKNDLDNSQRSKKTIEKFHIEINNMKNVSDDIKFSTEDLEMKRSKLTLHYMSALDYEKENKENGLETKKEGNDTENENFDTDAKDKSVVSDIFISQKSTEMSKQDLNSLPKEIDPKDMKNRSELQIHQNVNINGLLNEKEQLKEDNTQQNSVEIIKSVNDSQKAIQVIYDTTGNEDSSSKNQSPMKCNLTCYEETNKMHDSQEHFPTMQSPINNIFLSQNSSNASSNNEPDVAEVTDVKNKEAEKCFKTKCIREAEEIFIETATGCFKSEQNENSTEIVTDRKEENTENLKEDLPLNEGKVLFKYKIYIVQ